MMEVFLVNVMKRAGRIYGKQLATSNVLLTKRYGFKNRFVDCATNGKDYDGHH
jgi:hypothetical protein